MHGALETAARRSDDQAAHPQSRVFVGLGANLGDPQAMFRRVLDHLSVHHDLSLAAISPCYRTSPWGGQTEKPFINCVAEFLSRLDPHELLDVLASAEYAMGRRRQDEVRWADRQLDLDLLAAGDQVVNRPGLQVPHPRLALRRFVLTPWAEIAPDFPVPGHQMSVLQLLAGCTDNGRVELIEGRS